MRKYVALGLAAVILVVTGRLAETAVSRLVPTGPMLPPLAHSRFCTNYPDECKPDGKNPAAKTDERKAFVLTPLRRAELVKINAQVNRSIAPRLQYKKPADEKWQITPAVGDCNDYVVTKRHALRKLGWPTNALLVTEVELPWGEHHLVLVARTNEGDLVLDNRTGALRTVTQATAEYKWVRMESPKNPRFWERVGQPI